jgi:hypothetical protein
LAVRHALPAFRHSEPVGLVLGAGGTPARAMHSSALRRYSPARSSDMPRHYTDKAKMATEGRKQASTKPANLPKVGHGAGQQQPAGRHATAIPTGASSPRRGTPPSG